LPNGCLQQIAANRLTIPQDVIAILLQGFVRHVLIVHIQQAGHSGTSRGVRSDIGIADTIMAASRE
jgi:hypothetical protein